MSSASHGTTQSSSSECSSNSPIEVIVIDDQTVARLGTCQVLSAHPEVEIVGEATTTAEALQLTRTHRPDVIVTEMMLPDGLGTDLATALDGTGRSPHVLILSAYRGRENLEAFLNSTAVGYLLKQDDPKHLLRALHGLKRGTLGWYSSRVAGRLLALRRHEVEGNGSSLLTARERSLLTILVKGESNRSIADTLGLSVATVKNYLTSIYEKLGVDSRTKAIAWAHDQKLMG
jgi:DNA-binding NarL/FixJ family response regulator